MATRDTDVFEAARPGLLGLAYRILGSRADAEDAIQDTYLKWSAADREDIVNPAAWLTTVCTRKCLDMRRAADRRRVDYVGAWLPEPIHTIAEGGAEAEHMLASSLSTAFLLMLERLTPKERAAYLLHEIFEMSYPDIAEALELNETNCRKLVSRARDHVERSRVRHVTPPERQDQLLDAFQDAIMSGSAARLTSLLSEDIRVVADSGGKAVAIRRALHGVEEVAAFLSQGLHRHWSGLEWERTDLNGGRGLLIRMDGTTVAAVSFGYDQAGRLHDIFIVRNPDKLARTAAVAVQ
ncbi:RNA polymerase sigma factor SigJ [Microbaculum marinum]|uniref:RNA polymerase sigma factor SigJ n=1 Tax=Microbaculum marinum TaxID=1764581 RepID=A0AAW9RNJ3_9HYPH